MDSLESDSEETELVQEPDDCLLPEEDLYKAFVHGWQVVKLNFPKYIDSAKEMMHNIKWRRVLSG
jgi:hypothetical protein